MLSQITGFEKKNTLQFHLYAEKKIKMNQQTKQNRNKCIDAENKLIVAREEGVAVGRREKGS